MYQDDIIPLYKTSILHHINYGIFIWGHQHDKITQKKEQLDKL